jgi:site-specific DNA-cytosine methylase
VLTGITLCSGGGLAALGMAAAGVQLVGAVESDAAIVAVYRANHGEHVTVAPVQDVDYRPWAGVDVWQASPPCPSFSVAKQGGAETETDRAIAAALCRSLREIRPRYVWLENVEGYAKSASYRAIHACLDDLDYWSHAVVVNAADMGVAQTRRRLILRAVAGGLWQPFRPLPAPVPWVGWYAAIADLISDLPETQPAPWQLKRLRNLPISQLIGGGNTSDASLDSGWHSIARTVEQPAFGVAANGQLPRAILIDGMNARTEARGGLNILPTHEPAMSIPANGHGAYRAFLLDVKNSGGEWSEGVRDALAPAMTIGTDNRPSHWPRAFLLDTSTTSNDGGKIGVRNADLPAQTVRAGITSIGPS